MKKLGVIQGKSLEERPALFPDVITAYEGFFTLSLGRMYNEAGPQPISYSDINSYLDNKRIFESDERDEQFSYIRSLDAKYLELSHEKMKKTRERLNKKDASGNKGKRTRR